MIFSTFEAYEQDLYALLHNYETIRSSTLALIRQGKSVAIVQGELYFEQDVRLVVREQLLALPIVDRAFS